MKKISQNAYAEVDAILNLMDDKYTKMIPKKIRTMIKVKKTKDYNKKIVSDQSLAEQEISDEALAILAALNYNYWCKDEKRKKELIYIYSNNEKNIEKEVDEVSKFNKSVEYMNEKVKQEMLGLIIYKEPKWYKKIFKQFFNIFKIKKSKH